MPISQIIILLIIGLMGIYLIYALIKWGINRAKPAVGRPRTDSKIGKAKRAILNQDRFFVHDANTGEQGFRDISNSDKRLQELKKVANGLGRIWDFEGPRVHSLVDAGKEYVAIETYFDTSLEHNPFDVHEAIYQPEIGEVYDGRVSKNAVQQYGWLIPWTVGIAFIIFMTVAG